ncbi:LlaJI family restriction endonuclease [Clostridium sp. WB02_MRS01]|uniref:LlaJI family restriction endonuclease n=1 Tax=Clostridium sp. WB02_MRS01 TaxID=2605777 RepID=UPI0012B27902|nr:LlaJI family restriction endonuclease [Clostridium sp. WB02_MRS01]MSS11285.1 LlaJI family restriction endonuclease [Clostridium sp. WB02_MRS01]
MAKGFFRELKHYTLHSITKELGENIEETRRLVGILKKYGVVKAVKKSKPEFEYLSNQDIVLTDVTENATDVEYVFDYVGVVLLEGHVFKCYPKYILSTKEPIYELKKILRVIKKYNSNEQLVYLYNGEDDNKIFNRLAVSLHLLEEYFMYGIYTNQHEIIEINGEGEILWNRTIDETFAVIQNNRPYYIELQTQNVVDNDMDFFKQLHECVLTQCSTELKNTGLLQLFDIEGVELTDCSLVDFGDMDYILYRLQREIEVQYVTRKQNLLKTLYTYIANDKTDRDDINFSLYGTNNFNLVWEKVCSNNFGSVLDEKILKLPLGVSPEYEIKKNDTLRSIIDRPVWNRKNPWVSDSNVDTLRPDLICIYPCNEHMDYCFGIYDAKYYKIDFVHQSASWKVTGQPGVGDVTKQYLYQLAYDDFITKQGYKYIQNMFFCPQEEAEPDYGYVEMKMLHTMGDKNLENIAVVKLSADEMYNIYLANRKIEDISKYIPQVGQKKVLSQNFTNRMMTYLNRINQFSRVAEDKLEMKEERGKLIYPKQIKRELGAKIIYDAICPVASEAFYGFDPYEKVNGIMLAEDTGNSFSRCDQLADVALKIESMIKELSEQELKDETVISVVLKKCFEGMADINSMVEGNSFNKLIVGVMELIQGVYL